MRREGAPKERELLCGRIIDRPIRPLFPPGFYHEVQVFCLIVLSNYSSLHNHCNSLFNPTSLDHGKCSFIGWKARSRFDGCKCLFSCTDAIRYTLEWADWSNTCWENWWEFCPKSYSRWGKFAMVYLHREPFCSILNCAHVLLPWYWEFILLVDLISPCSIS